MEAPEFEIRIGDGFGNNVTFQSTADVETFFAQERDRWNWLNEEGFQLHDNRGKIGPSFSAIEDLIQRYKSANLTYEQLRDGISNYYSSSRPTLLFSDYVPGLNLPIIRDVLGADNAGYAYALISGGLSLDLSNFFHMRLWTILAMNPVGADKWAEEERRKLTLAREALRRELTAHRRQISAQISNFEEDNSRARTKYRRVFGLAMRIANRRATKVGNVAQESISKINDTDNAFTQRMALQAPVGYWRTKQRKHFYSAIGWAVAFIIFVGSASYFASQLFGMAWSHAESENLSGRHFLIVAGLGTVLTLLFWISRVFMRIFLGEFHLYTDAGERSVMTETYLALIKEGAASDQERLLILAALFRSAQDGIVKEEIGGEIGVSAILAKLLEPKKA